MTEAFDALTGGFSSSVEPPPTAGAARTLGSPSGHTYRLRRPPDALLSFDGAIPLLGEGPWRVQLARYDVRW